MRVVSLLVPTMLAVVAVIHFLPVIGVLSAGRIEALYRTPVVDANVEIMLRHRAVLFGLLAAALAWAALDPRWRGVALVGGLVNVASFVVLAVAVGGYNEALRRVVWIDVGAGVLLLVAGVLHFCWSPP